MTQPVTLAARAAAKAGRAEQAPTDQASEESTTAPAEQLPDLSQYDLGDDDPDMIPVHLAWLRVRRDIRAIGKGEQYNQSGTRFNFRGVDTVVNVFGPVTLKHGINVIPLTVEAEYGEKNTKSGSKMRECTVLTTWQIMGPMGDSFTVQTRGEALDTADKSTTKSQSVALRTLLLTLGLTPTNDPDPDSSYIERGEAPTRSARDYLDEILQPTTGRQRLAQINYEIKQAGLFSALVTNETGAEEQLGALLYRVGQERIVGDSQ
ncbi:ERF family protein [Kitasatospora sp. NPDC127116]|uniref:ERF family protein n=1 Tax=Kitasatospora sp. NPDC127116 TaxID=3345367 RepID=UPI0036396924